MKNKRTVSAETKKKIAVSMRESYARRKAIALPRTQSLWVQKLEEVIQLIEKIMSWRK